MIEKVLLLLPFGKSCRGELNCKSTESKSTKPNIFRPLSIRANIYSPLQKTEKIAKYMTKIS